MDQREDILKLKNLREEILNVSSERKTGHIPSAFSILEILYYLHSYTMKKEDVFLLSKGHGCLALYAVLLEMGLVTKKEFDSFSSYDSILGGHPDRNKIPGVFCSSGSLGHGLPISVGVALAKKIQQKEGCVYCLIGDGESNEGAIWEAAMLASHLKLKNLICLVDQNNSQSRSVPAHIIKEKFCSFGWDTLEVEDGHNKEQILNSFKDASPDKPTCIIFSTTKGYGVKEMEENMFAWHHRAPTEEELKSFVRDLRQ